MYFSDPFSKIKKKKLKNVATMKIFLWRAWFDIFFHGVYSFWINIVKNLMEMCSYSSVYSVFADKG